MDKVDTIKDVKTFEDAEDYLNRASEEYHNDPRNPSTCRMYELFHRGRCICEDKAAAELQANNL